MDAKYDLFAERNLRLSRKFSFKRMTCIYWLVQWFAEIIWNDMYIKLQISLFD